MFGWAATMGRRRRLTFLSRILVKGDFAMVYGEPETSRFLAAVERLKQAKQRKKRQTREAKQRVRATLRKLRECQIL
jgi:hypothetical protein